MRHLLAVLAMLPVAVGAQAPTYQIHHDLIRGRVTTDSGAAIAGGDVAVTMAPDRQTQFAKTNADGRYEVTFDHGTGDYLVHVAALGRETFRKRITRVGSDSVFTVDVVLKSSVQKLAAVHVKGTRPKPQRDEGPMRQPGVGAAERQPDGVVGALAPDQSGNLDAIAATLPGVNATSAGVSVLGLPPSQNNATLNGLVFSGSGVPRGARTATLVSTSTYDVARGGFAGAQTQLTLIPGSILTFRRAFLTLDAPPLQAVDAVGRQAGVPFAAADVNLGTNGLTTSQQWAFNTALELRRQRQDASSLTDASGDLLEHAGVSPDSVTRLLSALGALGIPVSVAGVPSSRMTDKVAFIGRLDRPLFDYNTFTPRNTTWGVTGFVDWTRSGALTMGPTATPAHAGESRQIRAGGQWLYSAYFGKLKDQLTDLRTGISVTQSSNEPYLRLPDGRVLVASSFADGTSGVATLGFGGNSGFESSSRTVTWETTSQTQLFWRGLANHRGMIYVDSRVDRLSREASVDRLGTFAFNSLSDLLANQPATFTRMLNSPTRTGGQWGGALGASDQWVANDKFTLLYGARVEGNAFLHAPAYNATVDELFGARTDHAPNTWHVSPRVGFQWLVTKNASLPGTGLTMSPMGTFMTMGRGAVRGGMGEFRQYLDPGLLADASVSTGLADGTQRIVCVGPAVPEADWRAFAVDQDAIPTSCAQNPSSPGFADAAPGVQLFAPSYQPARSWRGNLSWSSGLKSISYSVDAIYSYNLNQPSSADLNFAGVPSFTTGGEGRPVFVPATSIVGSTGAVANAAARRSSQYGPVMERLSDLRGWARQVSVRAKPSSFMFGGNLFLDATYTLTQTRSETRGFDGATFGDPRAVSWARGDYAPTHEITLQAGVQRRWWVISMGGKVSSGRPYTPLIGSDVNGDGLANDRAFVFDDATAPTPVLAQGMRDLLRSTSGTARDCLRVQAHSVAARNSCEGPWYATLNATASWFRLGQLLHFTRGSSINFNLSNPLAGLDHLLHGNNLHGWGSPYAPDPVLYYVRGFDSTARRFTYEVNPRFGDTHPSATTLRSPFRLTIDVSLDLSRNIDAQQVDRFLAPGRNGNPGIKLDSAAIVRRYCGNLPRWYDEIVSQADSLLLTRDQVDALRAAQRDYSARMMAHWGKWAGLMARLPDRYNTDSLVKAQNTLINDAWEIARQEAHAVLPKILTPVQLELLPGNAAMLYRAKEPITQVRYSSTSEC